MRYLVKTKPVHMIWKDTTKRYLTTYDGYVNFAVVMFDPGEEPPAGPTATAKMIDERTRPLAEWRARYGTPFVVPPPADLALAIGPQLVPESVLQDVPSGARLHMRWHFVPSDKWFEAEEV